MTVVVTGADIVLGMIPFARELLRMGAEVVMCANSQPAINDITAPELRALLNQVAAVCPVIKVCCQPCSTWLLLQLCGIGLTGNKSRAKTARRILRWR